MKKAIRLVTFAVPLSGNKGSASMFFGLRDAFLKAGIDAYFEVFSYYPRRDAQEARANGLENVDVRPGHPKHIAFALLPLAVLGSVLPGAVPKSWREHLNAIKEADVVLLIGGTTFADSMLYKVPWNVLAALPGFFFGRSTVLLSQTMGPFASWFNRVCARWVFTRATAVHGRGRISESHVRQLGLEHAAYRPDLSFSMRVPEFDLAADSRPSLHRLREGLRAGSRQAVGVAPNTIVLEKAKKRGLDYVKFMVEVIQEVEAQGYLPVLIPHSYRPGTQQLHNNDSGLCQAIIARLPIACDYCYLGDDLSPRELRAAIGQLHLLVASRFHAMVSALAMGVPPITYGWGHQKYSEVLSEFGVSELYIAYTDLQAEPFADRLRATSRKREELSSRIVAARAGIVAQADALASELLSLATRETVAVPGIAPSADAVV